MYVNQKIDNIKSSTTYFLSFKYRYNTPIIRFCEYKKDGTFIKRTLITSKRAITLDSDTDYIITSTEKTSDSYFEELQLSEGSTEKEYEAYWKLNVYEDGYFSRENGKWYLNNAYGEDDIDENYNVSYSTAKDDYYIIQIQPKVSIKSEKRMYCNLFKYIESGWNVNEENIGYGGSNLNLIQFKILGSRLSALTATSARKFLSDANTKVLSYLQTPSKTEIPNNSTLFNQLEDIYKLMSYDGTTIIETECEEGNLPILINAKALKGE